MYLLFTSHASSMQLLCTLHRLHFFREVRTHLQRYLSVVPPTERVWQKAFLRWVRVQGCIPDTPGITKNASGPVGIPLKKGRLRLQAINLTTPRRVKAWETPPPVARGMSSDEVHLTRYVPLIPQPAEV